VSVAEVVAKLALGLEPAASATAITVAPRISLNAIEYVPAAEWLTLPSATLMKTLLAVDLSAAVVTVRPVTSVNVVVAARLNVSVLAVLTTCNTLPAGSLAAAIVPVN
jgi:hypothetical protein